MNVEDNSIGKMDTINGAEQGSRVVEQEYAASTIPEVLASLKERVAQARTQNEYRELYAEINRISKYMVARNENMLYDLGGELFNMLGPTVDISSERALALLRIDDYKAEGDIQTQLTEIDISDGISKVRKLCEQGMDKSAFIMGLRGIVMKNRSWLVPDEALFWYVKIITVVRSYAQLITHQFQSLLNEIQSLTDLRGSEDYTPILSA